MSKTTMRFMGNIVGIIAICIAYFAFALIWRFESAKACGALGMVSAMAFAPIVLTFLQGKWERKLGAPTSRALQIAIFSKWFVLSLILFVMVRSLTNH